MENISRFHGSRRAALFRTAFIEAIAAPAVAMVQTVGDWISKEIRSRRMDIVRVQMHGLSDHYPRDIGLDRDQIDGLFR